jgi:hypothetical protein
MTTINFNAAATDAIRGRQGAKLRMEVKNGTVRVRPTDRKAGPHVLVELEQKGKSGVSVTMTDKQAEKLNAGDILANAIAFNVVPDKYGWFALATGEGSEEKAAGAKATVSKKS